MKTLFPFTIFIVMSINLYSQANTDSRIEAIIQESKFYENRFSVQIGMAIPQGEFGADPYEEVSDFAEPGFNFRIGYTYFLTKHLGLQIVYNNSTYNFNDAPYQESLSFASNDTISVTNFSASNYNTSTIAAGLFIYLNPNDQPTQFYINPMMGSTSLKFATLTFNGTYLVDIPSLNVEEFSTFTETLRAPNTRSLYLAINAGMDIELSENLSLNLNFQYVSSTHEVEPEIYYQDTNGISGSAPITYGEIDAQSINLTGGLAYRF